LPWAEVGRTNTADKLITAYDDEGKRFPLCKGLTTLQAAPIQKDSYGWRLSVLSPYPGLTVTPADRGKEREKNG